MLDHGVSREAIEAAVLESKKRHFHSSFQFLDAHNGIRRGCYSVIMGTPGCGKSGLSQAIAVQAASAPDTKVLMILTEESKVDYAVPMLGYADLSGANLSQITFFEESSMNHEALKSHDSYLAELKEVIIGSFADLVIIDNITTGRMYGVGTATWDQGKTVWFLKNLAKDLNIHISVVAHTRAEASDNMGRLFTTEDHKGVKSLGQEASFFYALQKFTSNGTTSVFCRNLKHRGYPNGAGTFLLKYDMNVRVYYGDEKVEFDKMKEAFGARDVLSKGR